MEQKNGQIGYRVAWPHTLRGKGLGTVPKAVAGRRIACGDRRTFGSIASMPKGTAKLDNAASDRALEKYKVVSRV